MRIFFLSFLLFSCTATMAGIRTFKDIPYRDKGAPGYDTLRNALDIYAPEKARNAKVFVFIHGGSWTSGSKDIYSFIGKRMARKGVVCVIINYRLSPGATYDQILGDCQEAVGWTYKNIESYGGDRHRIFLSGHSAGAQLAAAMVFIAEAPVNEYLRKTHQAAQPPVRGVILNDAFGLDLHWYLFNYRDADFYTLFSENPETWKKYSPVHSLVKQDIPFQVFYGGWTYGSIEQGSLLFHQRMKELGAHSELYKIPRRRHAWMVVQLALPWNRMYRKMLKFMEAA
jgi:acetyl esterase/lipase